MATARSTPHESFSTSTGSIVREYAQADIHTDKPPLVLLHGIGSGANHWGILPAKIGRHVFTVDVRQSDIVRQRQSPSINTYAEAVEATIDDIAEDGQVDLLGLSLGGVLAQEIAIRQERRSAKKRLAKLALVATIPGYYVEQPRQRTLAAMQAADRNPSLLNTTAGTIFGGDFIDDPELAKSLGLASDINLATNRQQLDALMSYMSTHPKQLLSIHGIMSFFNKNPISTITIPTLVMGGNPDPTTPIENSRAIHKAIPNSELVEFEDGGHLFALTRPTRTAAHLNQFLDRNRLTSDS